MQNKNTIMPNSQILFRVYVRQTANSVKISCYLLIMVLLVVSVSKEEVKVVWNRFRMLHPDALGCISRENFRRSPYNSNLFCKQVCECTGVEGWLLWWLCGSVVMVASARHPGCEPLSCQFFSLFSFLSIAGWFPINFITCILLLY